jgi:hypothetical protein
MALECLLKALWVKQKNASTPAAELEALRARGFPKEIRTHNVARLAKATSFSTTDVDENELLEGASTIITYIGRYPTPLTNEEFVVNRSIGHGRAAEAFERMYARLSQELA